MTVESDHPLPSSVPPVIVVGGGQSGLAAARALRELRMPTVILEASDRPTGSWPRYYDSLRVFSPAAYSSMPGMPFPGAPDHYPGRDEVTDYLEQYATRLDVEIQTNTRVETIQQAEKGFLVLTEDGHVLPASGIVAASGSFSKPYRPSFPGEETFTGELSHVADYRNDAGLVVSLTFGGRRVVGDGFGIPLVVRYLLETCETVSEARAVLSRLPYHMAHNLTLLDRGGEAVTIYVSPDREPVFRSPPVATNHQEKIEWPEQARATRTVEREEHIVELLEDPELTGGRFTDAFLRPPLHSRAFDREMGTIYTAAYWPTEGRVEYLWPGYTWQQSFGGFVEGSHTEHLSTDHNG